jgi:LPS sulfotransferase NodH
MRKISKPIFIIGSPRSGTTLLFNVLSQSEYLWSLYGESMIWNKYAGPQYKGWETMELTASDATGDIANKIRTEFCERVVNHEAKKPHAKLIRMVEKTPDNCFRIDFINRVFPDAYFIYIQRDGRNTISSMIEAWRYYKKFSVPTTINIDLQNGSTTDKWWGSLPTGWQRYNNSKVVDVCLFQWREANLKVLSSLKKIPSSRVVHVRYEELTKNGAGVIQQICKNIGIPYSNSLKNAVSTIYPVNPNKWKKNNEGMILSVYEDIMKMMKAMGYTI